MKKSRKKAFSLVEILLAIALFAFAFSTVGFITADTLRFAHNNDKRNKALELIQSYVNSLNLIKSNNWGDIIAHTSSSQQKYIVASSETLSIQNGSEIVDGVTVSFLIETIMRDENREIIESGGSVDVGSRKITITTTWVDNLNITNIENYILYLNNWNTPYIFQSTEADFAPGTINDTRIEATQNDGEIRLVSKFYANWCKPQISLTSYDLPGQGVAESLAIDGGRVVMGTGQNASGGDLIGISVDTSIPPNLTIGTVFDENNKTNGVSVSGHYAYLATDKNSEEVPILDISTDPFVKTGYFDAPGVTDADAIYVTNNVGYIAKGSTLYRFDASSPTGSRSAIGLPLELLSNITGIYVVGNYAYVTVNATSNQLRVIDVSNNLLMTQVAQASVNGLAGVDVYVTSDGNRAYLATENSVTQPEAFIINTTSKLGNLTTISAMDTGTMNPRGITYVSAERVIVGGHGGNEYQVFDVTTESSPSLCGSLNIDAGVNDVKSQNDAIGTAYSYVVTADSSNEFKIIQGGLGGGDANGNGYVTTGDYTSQTFDTESETPNYFSVSFNGIINANTTARIQLRTSTTTDFSTSNWIGPDGTSSTYFSANSSEYLPDSLDNKRYLQYKVYLTSDSVLTPYFEDVTLVYSK